MNDLLLLLSGGDLRSDGQASDVADFVIDNPSRLSDLLEGLQETNNVVRGRTAHAIERISRTHPEWLIDYLPNFIAMTYQDQVPFVKWHLAMTLGNLTVLDKEIEAIIAALLDLLNDPAVFVKSWAITCLVIIGKRYPDYRQEIIERINSYRNDTSIAVRSKVTKAIHFLLNEDAPLPVGWIKSKG
jgi:HEAT repeat protein